MKMKKLLLVSWALLLSQEALALSNEYILRGRLGGFTSSASAPIEIKGTGLLGEGAIEYLYNTNIGFEVAAGYGFVKIKHSSDKEKKATYIPLTATLKYTLPIYEQYYPYIGVGYRYGIVSSAPSSVKVSNKGGIIVKVGGDIYFEKTNTTNQPIGLNIDITQNLGAKSKNKDQTGGDCSIAKTTALIGITVPI